MVTEHLYGATVQFLRGILETIKNKVMEKYYGKMEFLFKGISLMTNKKVKE